MDLIFLDCNACTKSARLKRSVRRVHFRECMYFVSIARDTAISNHKVGADSSPSIPQDDPRGCYEMHHRRHTSLWEISLSVILSMPVQLFIPCLTRSRASSRLNWRGLRPVSTRYNSSRTAQLGRISFMLTMPTKRNFKRINGSHRTRTFFFLLGASGQTKCQII